MASGNIPGGVATIERGGTGANTNQSACENLLTRPFKYITVNTAKNVTLSFSATTRGLIFISGASSAQGLCLFASSSTTAYFKVVYAHSGCNVTRSANTLNFKNTGSYSFTLYILFYNAAGAGYTTISALADNT